MSYQKDKIALQKVVSGIRAKNEELKRVNDVNSRIQTRGQYIGELMNLISSGNENIRSLAPTFIFPVIELFETQQAADLRQGIAQKTQDNENAQTQDNENAQMQDYKTKLTNIVNDTANIPDKEQQRNMYFQISKNARDLVKNLSEPNRTKFYNIVNPILTPVEDKIIATAKDVILLELKKIEESTSDENTKEKKRTEYISIISSEYSKIHEPLKSKAKAMVDTISQQDGEDSTMQNYKTVLINVVNEISKITNKDEQIKKYFHLSRGQRNHIESIPEPKKTKVNNIANPILIPVEDKLVVHFKDAMLLELKNREEAASDENNKEQARTRFVSEMNGVIMNIHEPLKSNLKAMFDKLVNDGNKNNEKTASLAKAMQVEYDKFMTALGLKTNEVNASSKYINDTQSTIKSLVAQASSSIDNLKNKVTEISATVVQSNASLATLRTYITTVADNVTKSTQSLQEASSAARAAEQYKREAEIYKNQASQFKDLTNQELKIAKRINVDISNELVQAKFLMDGTAKALRGANSTTGSENIIKVIRPPNTNAQGFANINEGFEDYSSYTPEELRRYAVVQTYVGRENSARTRMLQASELLAQKESVANNIVMDYMYANEKGTTVNTIMDRISQLNNDKKRKLEINTYYNKARQQYIRILIVIVISCIIIVPLVIANKNNYISDLTFMILTVTIIFFTIIFIFYNFADIYSRDDMDFDKIKIPYDRTATLLEKDGSIIRKKNPLTSLTLTCIGQDCCDGSMVYDYARNKCIATENFGNMFEKFNSMNNTQAIVYPDNREGFINNSNFKNNMFQTSFGCSSVDKFMTDECRRPVEAQR
jgi:hypothetical protein